jgi:hypothetical protein
MHPVLVIASLLVAAAFCVAGLMIQHETDEQRRIADLVREERQANRVRLGSSRRTVLHPVLHPVPVPLMGAFDGGAPLPSLALIPETPDTPETPEISETPDIPDETPETVIGDIAEQPTQVLGAAEMAKVAAATAAREQVPPEILKAFGREWVIALTMHELDRPPECYN